MLSDVKDRRSWEKRNVGWSMSAPNLDRAQALGGREEGNGETARR